MHVTLVLVSLLLAGVQIIATTVHPDQWRKDVMQRSADSWRSTLEDALSANPVDQQRIYAVLLKGLVCNHHTQRNCGDLTEVESLVIRAIEAIKTNPVIFKKMMMNPKKIPSPFQRLYHWVCGSMEHSLC